MVTVLCIGKQHEPHIKEAVELYETRLKRFSRLEWVFLPHAGLDDVEKTKAAESDALLAKIKPEDTVVLMDERGEQWSSPEFSARLEGWQANSRGRLVFIIGGAYGVDSRVFGRAAAVWSLSKLVFPHQLVRVLVAEQLYRAFAIKENLPYHHS